MHIPNPTVNFAPSTLPSTGASGGGVFFNAFNAFTPLANNTCSTASSASLANRCIEIGVNTQSAASNFKISFWGLPLTNPNPNPTPTSEPQPLDCMGGLGTPNLNTSNPLLDSNPGNSAFTHSLDLTNIAVDGSSYQWVPKAPAPCSPTGPQLGFVQNSGSFAVMKTCDTIQSPITPQTACSDGGIGTFSISGPLPQAMVSQGTDWAIPDTRSLAFWQGYQNLGQAINYGTTTNPDWQYSLRHNFPRPSYVSPTPSPDLIGNNNRGMTLGYGFRLDSSTDSPAVYPFGNLPYHLGYGYAVFNSDNNTASSGSDAPSKNSDELYRINKNYMVIRLRPEITKAVVQNNSQLLQTATVTLIRTSSIQTNANSSQNNATGCPSQTATPSVPLSFYIGIAKGSADVASGLNYSLPMAAVMYDPYTQSYVRFKVSASGQGAGSNMCVSLIGRNEDGSTKPFIKPFITTVSGSGSRLSGFPLPGSTTLSDGSIAFNEELWQLEMTFNQFLAALDAMRQSANAVAVSKGMPACNQTMADAFGSDYDQPSNWKLLYYGGGQEIYNNNLNYSVTPPPSTRNDEKIELVGYRPGPNNIGYVDAPELKTDSLSYIGARVTRFDVFNAEWTTPLGSSSVRYQSCN